MNNKTQSSSLVRTLHTVNISAHSWQPILRDCYYHKSWNRIQLHKHHTLLLDGFDFHTDDDCPDLPDQPHTESLLGRASDPCNHRSLGFVSGLEVVVIHFEPAESQPIQAAHLVDSVQDLALLLWNLHSYEASLHSCLDEPSGCRVLESGLGNLTGSD